jgi:hypothetical protein
MSDVQSQLAELLKTGTGDPPGRITVRDVLRERARRHVIAAVGVTTAIAVVAGFSIGLFVLAGNPGPAVSPGISAVVPCRSGWHTGPGAAPAGDRSDRLVAVAGSGPDDLWAVGERLPDSRHVFPLLEHWNGRRWAYSAGASLRGRQAYLTSVAALTADDIWAVGDFASVGSLPPAPLIEHWNGRSWSLQPTDALARLGTGLPQTLVSVAVVASDDVWVLGTPGSRSSDVYLHWNGASWQLLRGPRIGPHFGSAAMQVIAADHRGHLWAAGGWMRGYGEAAVPGGGTAERWNGHRWAVDQRARWTEPLTRVAPVAPDDAWAVAGGSFSTAGTYGVTPVQVLHWNGTTWRVQLDLGAASSAGVTGLVALSAGNAYMTGGYTTTGQPFIRHWNGVEWRSLPLPRGGDVQQLGLIGLTATSGGSVAALGVEGQADRTNALWLQCQH